MMLSIHALTRPTRLVYAGRALVPTLLTLATVTLRLRLRLGGPGFSFISFVLFLAPDLAMLAYGIARIVRPVPLMVV